MDLGLDTIPRLASAMPIFSDTEGKRVAWYIIFGMVALWAVRKVLSYLPAFPSMSFRQRLADMSGQGARVAAAQQVRSDVVGDADQVAPYQPGANCQAGLARARAHATAIAGRTSVQTEGLVGDVALSDRLRDSSLTRVAQGH